MLSALSRRKHPESLARVVVHDFSGHPFQVQLARELGARGLNVTHLYCPSFQTPKGAVDSEGGTFHSRGVALRQPFAKYSGIRRFFQEMEYGWRLARKVRSVEPDVVVSANTPLLAAVVFQVALRVRRIPIVFWQQDVYSVAMGAHLVAELGRIGRPVGWLLMRVERWLLRSSDRVVVISEDFLPTLDSWCVDLERVTVIENWAPLDELPQRDRPNGWSREQQIGDEVVFLYAGTLGLKHEPSILLELTRAVRDRDDVRVMVASEGIGASWLAENADPDDGLKLLPFQPYEALPDMLGAADVLIVLLEPEAGRFSVPSKVLTYHCAGRPILGAMPLENLASRSIVAAGSGVVVRPGDQSGFVEAALELVDDPCRRVELGQRAREHAERTFAIAQIGDRFIDVIESARKR